MINSPYKQRESSGNTIHPGWQFLVFAGIFVGALFIGTLIGLAAVYLLFGSGTIDAIMSMNPNTPHILTALWILQITGTTLPIFAAPVFFAYVVVAEPRVYLKTTFRFHWGLLLLVLLVAFLSLPSMELLSNINEQMKLPSALKSLEDWMKTSEKEARDVTDIMLDVKTVWGLLFDLLLIGLVTAIVEEFMFRGVLQTIIFRWTKSVHAAVWITGILFSAFHMEFYGFLPRLLLGVLFGYFVAWSGSIWPAVWAHFLNNGVDVVVTYLSQQKMISINPDDEHMFNYWGYTFSVVILVVLMLIFRKVSSQEKSIAPV